MKCQKTSKCVANSVDSKPGQHCLFRPVVWILRLIWYHVSNVIKKTCLFKYIEILTVKNWSFRIKFRHFSNFCSKHRLWVLVRTASPRWGRNKKNNVYPCKPQLYYIKKWDLRGSKLCRYVFVMVKNGETFLSNGKQYSRTQRVQDVLEIMFGNDNKIIFKQ